MKLRGVPNEILPGDNCVKRVPTAIICSYKSSINSSSQSHNSDTRLHAQCLALLCMPLCALQNVPTCKLIRFHGLRQGLTLAQFTPAYLTRVSSYYCRTPAAAGYDLHANSQGSKEKSPVQKLLSRLAPCLCACLQKQEQQRSAFVSATCPDICLSSTPAKQSQVPMPG